MQKITLFACFALLLGSAPIHADQASSQPQLLLNADAMVGGDLAPSTISGSAVYGGRLALEWLPNPYYGFDLGYNYLGVGKTPNNGSDDDITLGMRFLPVTWDITTLSLWGGIGYNATPNDTDGHYVAYVGPGLRVVVAPRLSIDGGVQYDVNSPHPDFRQSLMVTVGIAVPLDNMFPNAPSYPETQASQAPSAKEAATPAPTAQATAEPTAAAKEDEVVPLAETSPKIHVRHKAEAEDSADSKDLASYKVKEGEYLWAIAAKPEVLGDSQLWPLLLDYNKAFIHDQDFIQPGMVLRYRHSYTDKEKFDARMKQFKTLRFKPHKPRKELPVLY